MIVKIGKINIGIVCILWFFSSCIDETFTNTGDVEGTFIFDFFIICDVCAGVECDRHSLSINIEGDNLCGYICQVVD